MSTRFYINWPLQPGPVVLEGPEAHHLAVVCRLRPGDAVCLFNGDGQEYAGTVTESGRRRVRVDVAAVAHPARELDVTIEVAAPLPKGDRAQFLVEKLTELGVTAFQPLQCERSNARASEAKQDKLARYVIEASKQCGRNTLMGVLPLRDWSDYCSQPHTGARRCFAQPGSAKSGFGERAAVTWLAVGPEGGFTPAEVSLALANDWAPVDLGPRILRTETAALVLACRAIYTS